MYHAGNAAAMMPIVTMIPTKATAPASYCTVFLWTENQGGQVEYERVSRVLVTLDSHHSKDTRFDPHGVFTIQRPRWTGGIGSGIVDLGHCCRMFVMIGRGRFYPLCRRSQSTSTGTATSDGSGGRRASGSGVDGVDAGAVVALVVSSLGLPLLLFYKLLPLLRFGQGRRNASNSEIMVRTG
jgi:hypothetical protein